MLTNKILNRWGRMIIRRLVSALPNSSNDNAVKKDATLSRNIFEDKTVQKREVEEEATDARADKKQLEDKTGGNTPQDEGKQKPQHCLITIIRTNSWHAGASQPSAQGLAWPGQKTLIKNNRNRESRY